MRESFKFAFTRGILIVVILAAILEIFPDQSLFIFSYSGEMLDNRPEMVEMLKIMCLYIGFFAFTPLCSGYMQAMGHPNRSLIMALWRNAILITFYLIAIQQTELTAIAWALVFGHMVGATSILAMTLFTDRQVAKRLNEQQ
jgi:Na+-driven multidrug efflux pump